MKKKETPTIFILTGIIISIVLYLSFLVYQNSRPIELEDRDIEEFLKNTKESEIDRIVNKIEAIDEESSQDSPFGSLAGGGSGTESLGANCFMSQISYSMINFNETNLCNTYQGNICTNKTIICSIEIHNRDLDISGSFKIESTFLEKGKNESEKFDITTSEFLIGPMKFKIMDALTNINSSGQDGLANKDINCFYNTLKVPKKEVCE